VSGRTPNGARISAVYTPAEHRKRGYASVAVATVSDALVKRGVRFCLLFADARSRATCSVYERIGYRHFRDSVALRFSK
jgi:predicted GNAT family acetyltransferase